MTEQPFAVFRPYADRVRVRLYDRGDHLSQDSALETSEGCPIAGAEQPHNTLTVIVRAPAMRVAGADGLATDTKGLALHTRGADCQIFAVYDPTHHCGGVLHAGWRGVVAHAIPAFVDVMKREWNTNPADLLIGAGPSLCFACAEFTDPVQELAGIDRRFFDGRLADLRAIADSQWTTLGAQARNIERHPDCTKCMKDRWWSLRGGDKEFLREGFRNALTFSLQ